MTHDVSRHNRQLSFTGLHSPGRFDYTVTCYHGFKLFIVVELQSIDWWSEWLFAVWFEGIIDRLFHSSAMLSDFCLTDRSIDWVVQSFSYFMVFFLVSGQSSVTVTSSCASLLTIETRTAGLIYSNYNGTYLDHMNCNWTISSNAKLELAFIRFQTESGYDFVKVYDGPTSSSTLIGEYDGDSLPTLITGSSHELFMSFTTDGSVTNPGFLANYHSEY